MYNNATFVNKEQLKLLKEMDSWLAKTNFSSEDELAVAIQVRNLITEIENKGYYYEGEADVLNMMRQEFIKYKKKNK